MMRGPCGLLPVSFWVAGVFFAVLRFGFCRCGAGIGSTSP
ncbi:hypothetical protein ACVINW_006679 [Bradyrhizobium sp. USDA 4461]